MAMTYATLTAVKGSPGSVYTWVNYALLDLDTIILDAQSYLLTTLRCREMRTSSTISLVAAASTFPLPTGFLDPISLRDKWKCKIQLIDPDQLEGEKLLDANGNILTGTPQRFCISDEQLQFEIAADVTQNLYFRYYVAPTYISSGNQSNFLATRYPHLLRRALLMFSADYLKDTDSYARHEQLLASQLNDVLVNDDLASATEQVPVEFD